MLISLVVLAVGVFMAGSAFGARRARLDYEPIIERLLRLLEKRSTTREGN